MVALQNSCKIGRTSAKVHATKSRRNFSQRTHPIHHIRHYTDVLMRFILFGCIEDRLVAFGCIPKLGAKSAELVQKFEPRGCIRIIRNECTRCTPFYPKLMFWCVSYYLGVFGTVWLLYETQSKTGRTIAKVRAANSRRNFSQRTHPIHPHWILN